MGVKGACPLGLPPPLGERGGHPPNFHATSKNTEGIFLDTSPEELQSIKKRILPVI
jgi:hypothetical protein